MIHQKENGFGRAPGDTPEPASFDEVVEIRFPESEVTSELVSATLWRWGCQGSIVENEGTETLLTAWFEEDVRGEVVSALGGIADVTVRRTKRDRTDWLSQYEQSLEPLLIGKRFVVSPRLDLVTDSERIAIVVPQEQAFGTGSHESTWMCLEMLEELELQGTRCLDVGTGSGILAIAMIRLGASKVFAFDNDVSTWGVIDRNLTRNAVPTGRIRVFYSSAEALHKGGFEVVTMNILPHVIVDLLPHVLQNMSKDGALIISGILLTQRDEFIAETIASGLTLEREREKGEWWAGLLRKQ